MSSAKRTPRYVDVIRPLDKPEAGRPAEILRLRPEPMGPALPPVTRAWARPKAVPVAHRPWQLLLVPPTPGAPTQSYHLARWQARAMLIAASVILIVACAGVTAFVIALRSPDAFATSSEASRLRLRLALVEDSLSLARADLDEPVDALAGDSAAIAVAPLAPSAKLALRPATRLVAAVARAASRRAAAPAEVDEGSTELHSGAFEGLPVIGAIASRFSRSRWHPLLHVSRPHLGVDVAARRGTKIIAPAAGRVTFVGRKFGFGLVLEIEHRNGITTRYAHCATALVAEGARVDRGTAIATVGTSGLSTGPHLHYEVLVHGHQVDPLRFRMPQMSDSSASAAATAAAPAPAATTPAPTPQATAPK